MIFDAHADIWTDITKKLESGKEGGFRKYHYNSLIKGKIWGGIFVIWNDKPYPNFAKERMDIILKNMELEIEKTKDILKVVRKFQDIELAISENKIFTILGIEGLAGIEKNIQDIEKLYELGIRHGNLTWNEENELGTGVKGNSERGITEKGRKLLKKMEDLGMIIDVSHANEKSFWDILESTKTPIIASHSNAQTLCNVARNLSDEQLRAIAKRRGVVGINSYKNFIDVSEENQTLERLVDHIDYMVKIMGIDYVGLGFDFGEYFDPDGKLYGPKGLEKPEEAKNILNVLGSRGYSKEDIEKIAFKNFFRVIKEILN